MLGVVIGIGFFLSLFSVFSANKERSLLLIISMSGFIQALWGMFQLFSMLYGQEQNHGESLYGVFQQRNVFASYLVTTYIAALVLLSRYTFSEEKINRLLLIGIIFFSYLVGILIFTIQSRTGYLSLLIALLLLIIGGTGEFRKSMLFPMLFLGFGAILGTMNIGIGGIAGTRLLDSLSNPAMMMEVSSSGRDIIWRVSWEMLKDNWLSGVGYGNFEPSFLNYEAQHYLQYGGNIYPYTNHPHNELLLWAVEGGFLPGTALASYSIYILWRMYKMGAQVLPYAAMLIPLVAHAMLEYPFYHSAIHWILFLTLLFLFELHASKTVERQLKYKGLTKGVAFITVLFASAFFITSLQAAYKVKEYYKVDPSQRTISMLENIINPVSVKPQLDYIALNTILQHGLKTKDKTSLNTFLELANELVKQYPRPGLYLGILYAYNALGDEAAFDKMLKQASYYYPSDERLKKLSLKKNGT